MKKTISISVALVAVGLVIYGFSQFRATKKVPSSGSEESTASALPILKVAVIGGDEDNVFVLKYAEQKGYFTKFGLEVRVVETTKALYDIVAAKEADVMFGGLSRPLAIYFNDVPARLLFNAYRPLGLNAVSRFDKNNLDKIRKVAVTSIPGENQQMAQQALENLGVDFKNIEYVAAPGVGPRVAIMERGDADFTVFTSRSVYDNNEQLKNLFFFGPEEIGKNSNLFRSAVTSQEAIDTKSDLLQKFTSAYYAAMSDMQQNRDEVVKFEESQFSMSPQYAGEFFDRFLTSSKEVSFVPDAKDLSNVIDLAKKDSSNPDKNLADFLYTKFASNAISVK